MDEQGSTRRFTVEARSTDTFGRVLCAARDQHFVVDGPVQNGCPGEAVTPAEIFLAGVATCGVELLQVIARAESVPLRSVSAQIEGWIDRDHPVRPDGFQRRSAQVVVGWRYARAGCRSRREVQVALTALWHACSCKPGCASKL